MKSFYDSGDICPIRAEISTHEHWENVFILLFVWLVVIDFRQNNFHILPNFWDFWAKMSFFRYIFNQKRKIFIKHCLSRVPKHHLYQRCVSILQTICVNGVLEHGGDVLQTKNGVEQAYNTWNTVIANGNYINGSLFDKNMKFCILVINDLTNDISYDVKLKKSKNCYFWGKIVKILWKNREKLEIICSIHISWYIGIKFCTVVVHILNKDVSYDSKLNKSKNLSFWGKIFKFCD